MPEARVLGGFLGQERVKKGSWLVPGERTRKAGGGLKKQLSPMRADEISRETKRASPDAVPPVILLFMLAFFPFFPLGAGQYLQLVLLLAFEMEGDSSLISDFNYKTARQTQVQAARRPWLV